MYIEPQVSDRESKGRGIKGGGRQVDSDERNRWKGAHLFSIALITKKDREEDRKV